MAVDDFSGTWQFCYWYPSNNHNGEDRSEYRMHAHQKDGELVLESMPNDINAATRTTTDSTRTGRSIRAANPGARLRGRVHRPPAEQSFLRRSVPHPS